MKKLVPYFILFFALNIFSQKEANVWYLGRNAGVDFNTTPPTAITDGQINTLEGCSSFADAEGNLLFYSDGIEVYNKDHSLMTYTDGSPANNLKGNPSSTQSGMIIPKPGSTTIYYLFTVGDNNNPAFDLFTIDMALDSGNGQLIDEDGDGDFFEDLAQQAPANKSNWTEKVAAVNGRECNTFWVVSKVANFFYSYKIDETGVNLTPVISTVNITSINTRGYLKLSPNGEKLAIAHQNEANDVLLYSFNNETGVVTNDGVSIFNNFADGEAYGVEFSRTSEKLYVSSTSGFRRNLSEPETTYKLFQFDLTSIDIEASKALIHEQIGYRGALQLGPDGKIYATIPLAYDDINGDAAYLDVIENPDADAADVIFTENAIDLNGQFATQGLPPFISSLLLPIEISDSDTNEILNNQDLQYCIGDNKTIIPETVTGTTATTYEWFLDNGTSTTSIATTSNLTLDNLSFADSGIYLLVINLTDDCGNVKEFNGTFNIEVFEAAIATAPEDIVFCDTDRDGFNAFDLQTERTSDILNGLSSTTFDVLYFDSMQAANDNITGTEILNPYTNPTAFSSQTIYARVHNSNAPGACFDITEFRLSITDLPIPTQPEPYRICDDTTSGSDTDGITTDFILSTRDSEILGALIPAQYNVSYHITLADAQTSSTTNPIDKNADYQVNNSQRIYVRVENIDNVDCNAISDDTTGSTFMSFELIVDPLPVLTNNPAELIQCHNNPDLSTTVNLTLARPTISANYLNETFRYFPTEADAIAESNEVTATDIETYPVIGTGEAWVRVISDQNCYRISKIEITVNFSADLAYDKRYIQCDDFLDADGNDTAANSDTDGITAFDFSDSEDEIKAFFLLSSQPDLDIFYYESESDRTASINNINSQIANHRNNNDPSFANNQTIYVKIINNTNNGCTGTAKIFLQVNQLPIANIPTNFELCDDSLSGSTTDGENIAINLRDKVADILGPTQTEADYLVTFHTSFIDADDLSSVGITNNTNFTNTAPAGFSIGDISEQDIFVRVQIRNSSPICYNSRDSSFKIIVNPIPVVTAITPLPFCDIPNATDADPRNRIAQNIDLTSKVAEILNGRTNHRVAFYTTSQNAQNSTPEITNTTSYENDPALTTFPVNFSTDDPGLQTIFYKVIDETGIMCESIFATFNLLIYPEPNIPVNVSDFSECDNTSDSFENDANGINGDITLKNIIPEILVNYQPSEFDDFSITFYLSLADAESGDITLALDENIYQNTVNNETIYVRVENIRNTPIVCVNTRLSFNINIKPLPSFTVLGEEDIDDPQILCLNDLPFTIEAENPGATYSYQWTDETGTVLGNSRTLEISTGGKYIVTASDQSPDGCSRTRTTIVNESNIATLDISFITIVDEGNNIGSHNNLSISIDTINNDLGPGDYQFAVLNMDNGTRIPFAGFQDEPLFENLEGGFYNVIVNDKNGCSPDTTLLVSVLQFPPFFTPNSDGENDYWVIKGANITFYPNSSINIFNRYGKLVAQLEVDDQGWDGTYNGRTLSSDDYWFSVTLIPADITKPPINKQGNFSLLRK